MELERVKSTEVNFVNYSDSESESFYTKIGDISVGVGFSGLILELLTNQNAGLIANSTIASIILFGIAISNLPEYKGK